MKLLYALAILSSFVLAGVSPANSYATELNIEDTVSFTPSCTLWNAQTYRLNFNLPDDPELPLARFEGNIWGSGINHLKAGTTFSIDGPEGSEESTGDAYVLVGSRHPVFVKAKFTRVRAPDTSTDPNGFGKWMIEIPMPRPSTKSYIYMIDPVIGETQTLCEETRKLLLNIR